MGWLDAASDAVPAGDAWLTPHEIDVQARLTVPKRRADWRLGRWTAKQAVRAWSRRAGREVPAARAVDVTAAPDGAPEVTVLGVGAGPVVSISHRAGRAVVAVSDAARSVGCDLEIVESRRPVFVDDWFTEAEARLVRDAPAADHDLLVTLVWAAKEAAVKARREGLRIAPRRVEVVPELPEHRAALVGPWRPLLVGLHGEAAVGSLAGWWHRPGLDRVLAVVAEPPPTRPVGLEPPA